MNETIELKEGLGVTRHGYTDALPYEVTRVVNPKHLHVRGLKAERDPSWKPEVVPGGFAGHCVNNYEQRWFLSSQPEAKSLSIRLHKNGRWYDARGNRYTVGKATYFYDYNF